MQNPALRRTIFIIAAITIAGLLITGLVVAINNFRSSGDAAKISSTNQKTSSADSTPVDRSSDGSSSSSTSTGSGPTASSSSSTQSQQSTTTPKNTPSTGPSNAGIVVATSLALGGAAYMVTRATQAKYFQS